jgi:D-alanyl-D-alanine carboxypeptidase/D-alanyl-D-alanine-endopeptidase (penicillin-binding protein 4)
LSAARRIRILVPAVALAAVAFAQSAPAAVAEPTLQSRLRGALATSQISSTRTGAFVLELSTGGLVYAQNASAPLRPASNEKLAVAFAALAELGPAFTIETAVLGEGIRSGPVWDGDLFLKGYGDPTLSRADLGTLARRVRAAGITRVTGWVLGDESFFDRKRTAPGWKPSFYKNESPPLSALVVDRARVAGRTVGNPALAAAVAFRRALVAAGVRVAGQAGVAAAAPDAVPLGRVVSARISGIVRRMNRASDNFIAETLLKGLGAHELGIGSTAAGARVVVRELRERGVPLEGVRIVDGSGLSSYDRLTGRALAALLVAAWSDPVIKPAFVASLPVAGVSGTLDDRMETGPARGRVRAKTGTTGGASALSGYVGTRYVFSILMNARPLPTWSARRAQDRFAQLLAAQ